MVVEDDVVDEVVHLIIKNAKTGEDGTFGDGKIFVSEVERALYGEQRRREAVRRPDMKEVMAVIRINKINETKRVLSENGFSCGHM